jgi:hypothetical protein
MPVTARMTAALMASSSKSSLTTCPAELKYRLAPSAKLPIAEKKMVLRDRKAAVA